MAAAVKLTTELNTFSLSRAKKNHQPISLINFITWLPSCHVHEFLNFILETERNKKGQSIIGNILIS